MLYSLTRRLLFHLDPETAHNLTLGALRLVCRGPVVAFMTARAPLAPTRVMNIDFLNPVRLAASGYGARNVSANSTLGSVRA